MASDTPLYSANAPFAFTNSNRVAIPRGPSARKTQTVAKDKKRVSQACVPCRAHKIKCSGPQGGTQECTQCASNGRRCEYNLRRKDKLKIVTDRCVQMAGLLRDLRSRAGEEDDIKIRQLLEAVEQDLTEARQTSTLSPFPNPDDNDVVEGRTDEVLVSDAHLDTDALDLVDDDLHKDERARATGYVGKSSEVQWLRNAMQHLERRDDEVASVAPQLRKTSGPASSERVSSFTFYRDSDSINPEFSIDVEALPALELARQLLKVYMERVHDSFPILSRQIFEDQFDKYFTALESGRTLRSTPHWQAILNLVFAISAKYSHLVQASWRAEADDHLVYQARARHVATLVAEPDLLQIQVLGLLAFYYFAVGQINRAWVMVGMAFRYAYSLGLHIRNEDPGATTMKREMMVRIWWSLYSLERPLSIITGRPSVTVDSYCSVPLPIPLSEDEISKGSRIPSRVHSSSSMNTASTSSPTGRHVSRANPGSYFRAMVQLGIITQDIVTSLYSAGTMTRAHEVIQKDIGRFGERIDEWQQSLPVELNFQYQQPGSASLSTECNSQRLILGFELCSARILLTRPCLGSLAHTHLAASSFGPHLASRCIDMAKTMIDFLPAQPTPVFLYEQGPWWGVVHYLMQATSVFLLALAYSASDTLYLTGYVRKTLRWLDCMQDPLAASAHRVALTSFTAVTRRQSLEMADVWSQDDEGQFTGISIDVAGATDYGWTQLPHYRAVDVDGVSSMDQQPWFRQSR